MVMPSHTAHWQRDRYHMMGRSIREMAGTCDLTAIIKIIPNRCQTPGNFPKNWTIKPEPVPFFSPKDWSGSCSPSGDHVHSNAGYS